jgi:hypothetical protein
LFGGIRGAMFSMIFMAVRVYIEIKDAPTAIGRIITHVAMLVGVDITPAKLIGEELLVVDDAGLISCEAFLAIDVLGNVLAGFLVQHLLADALGMDVVLQLPEYPGVEGVLFPGLLAAVGEFRRGFRKFFLVGVYFSGLNYYIRLFRIVHSSFP